MGPERMADVEAVAQAARAALGSSPDSEELQQFLFDSGVHGLDAVLATVQVLGVGLSEANAAFFGSPVRTAERDLQNSFIDALELAAVTGQRQQKVCAEHQVPWTPPEGGAIVGLARDVGAGRWPVHGFRRPVGDTTCGWHLWAGEVKPGQDADYFQPVHVEHLYERCPEALPYLGLPPGWRFLIAPDYSDVWATR